MSILNMIEMYRTMTDEQLDFIELQLSFGTWNDHNGERLYAIDKVREERNQMKK